MIFPNFDEYSRALGAPGTIDCGPNRTILATEEQLRYMNREKINYMFLSE